MNSKKIMITIIICIIIVASTAFVFAEGGQSLHVDNINIVTNDKDATFINGSVDKACGQTIVVKSFFRKITEKTMPNTGESASFRIKVPASAIGTDRVTVFKVFEDNSDANAPNNKERVEISYIEKKNQEIKVDREEYKMTFPGLDDSIAAKASSGEQLIYSSDNSKVVEVDSRGKLVSKGEGDATITIKQIGNNEYDMAEKVVKVSVEAIDAYTVTYHSSDDENKTIRQIINTGTTESLQENAFENGDHEFLGWARSDDGLVEFEDGEEIDSLAELGENVDLYAVWTGDGARAAVAWAIRTANDDSFAYGTGDACHSAGCYYCGTNRRNKPRGYEKTYVCLTFVEAAYAHGTEDPELLAECQAGRRCMAVNDSNFTRYSCWEKVGYTRNLTVDDLEPGDVICYYNAGGYDNGHMEMYAGNGAIVDSRYEGWGADTLALRPGTAASELRAATSHSSNSYVMRYVGPNREPKE